MLQSLHNNSGLKPAVVITVNCEPTTVNGYQFSMVEMGGFEPPTPALRRQCSPPELHPLKNENSKKSNNQMAQ